MNYALVKGHYKALFTKLPEGGYHVIQYQFMPGHLNWTPISGKRVSQEEAVEIMQRLAKQNYLMTKGG